MTDFLNDLFSNSKLETKPVTETVSVSVETTRMTEMGTVKETKEIKNETKQVEHQVMAGPVPYISIEMGATINLGNYSNGKVKVGFHLPVGTNFDEALNAKLEETFTHAKAWVEQKMDHEAGELAKLRGKV